MPHVLRPDGAEIAYEVEGDGFPLLLFAPGGVSSEAWLWREVSHVNPFDLADEFMVIGMNQRHSTGSPGPLVAPDWATYAADQRAVLDELGVDRALLWGGCIGVAFCLRFIMEAPDRVAAAVGQDPVGLVEGFNDRSTFWRMFEPTVKLAREQGMAAVVKAALDNPLFFRNHEAGPFAARIAADEEFRAAVEALAPDEYVHRVRRWDDRMWGGHGAFMSVPETFVAQCRTPLLILPGDDDFHPTATAQRLCAEALNARCLDVDCRSPEKLPETAATIRTFLHDHT